MDGHATEVIPPARGVQRGCNLDPLRYSAGSHKILREFRADSPVLGARELDFIDDITVNLPPESTRDTGTITKVMSWLRENLDLQRVQTNRSTFHTLWTRGTTLEDLSETQCGEMVATQLKVAGPETDGGHPGREGSLRTTFRGRGDARRLS